jgi:glycosyltransferase involved in cell wall biosynthesis
MKILIYSESFFPSVGGIETITFQLALGLAEASTRNSKGEGFEVIAVTHSKASAIEDLRLPFRIVRNPSLTCLSKLILDADVLHLAGPALLPLILALAWRKPVVVEHHGFQVACPNGQFFYTKEQRLCPGHYMAGSFGKCYRCNLSEKGSVRSAKMLLSTPVRRFLANKASLNITPTDWLAGLLKLKRMETIHHGLRVPAAADAESTIRPIFAFQGRLVSTKGVAILIEAAKQLSAEAADFSLRIIGDGPLRGQLEEQAASLGGRVQFLGYISDEQLEQVLSDVSAVVVPSLAGEVFGLVTAENMLRRKALIVSDLGALKEVVDDTGIVTTAGDAPSLAAGMRRVVQDPAFGTVLGANALARARLRFTLGSMIQQHIDAYRRALS